MLDLAKLTDEALEAIDVPRDHPAAELALLIEGRRWNHTRAILYLAQQQTECEHRTLEGL